MAKINYSEDDKQAKIEMQGNTLELVRAVSRIAAHLKAGIKMKGGKTFEEVLLEGIKVAETQNAVNKLMDDKDSDVSKLVSLLEKLLND